MKVGAGTKIYTTAKIVEEGHEISIGQNCLIGDFAFIAARVLVMDDMSQISPHAVIVGGGEVRLGKCSVIGFGAILIPATDSPSGRFMCEAKPEEERDIVRGSITLGQGAYVGSGAVICISKKCPNIKIGENAIVGALSYIDESVAPNTITRPIMKHHTTPRRVTK